MTRKIFLSIFALSAIMLTGALTIFLLFAHLYHSGVMENSMEEDLKITAAGVSLDGERYLSQIDDPTIRLTWIDPDGTVLYDSQYAADEMESHKERVEFREALEEGVGTSSRYSSTGMKKTIYKAMRLADGTVLRIARDRSSFGLYVVSLLQPLLIVLFVSVILSFYLAHRLADSIMKPLENLDLNHPEKEDTYPELEPIFNRLGLQHQQLQDSLAQLKKQQQEFDQAISSMPEGLILMDENLQILTANKSAKNFLMQYSLSQLQSEKNKNVDSILYQLIEEAKTSSHVEKEIVTSQAVWLVDLSVIESDRDKNGYVILITDRTQKALAEKSRREFTANVSHELKTPLSGIIGSAELLENNLVKEEDLHTFYQRIEKEARKLLNMVNQMLRISRMEEKQSLETQPLNLKDLCGQIFHRLEPVAKKKDITFHLEGESATIESNMQLVEEILYNLIENSIKYNVDHGSVTAEIQKKDQSVSVLIKDTGQGIALHDQQRIFDRFYRGDHSHDQTIEGSGLGLSLVRHAIEILHGTIKVNSAPGKGSVFEVNFPVSLSSQSELALIKKPD